MYINITLLLYKSTICTSSTYHIWRQISTCNNIIMPYWLQRVPQISISNIVREDLLWWKKQYNLLVIGSHLHPPKYYYFPH